MTDVERTLLGELHVSVTRIETALLGNGTKGLAARMSDREDWAVRHEDSHKAYREDQHNYRIKREQKEASDAKKKNIRQWAFVGSVALIIIGQVLIGIL